jgi:hypothetical protein
VRDGLPVSEVLVRDPLATYAAGFAAFLAAQGYVPGSVRLQAQLVAELSRWLDAEGLSVDGLTELQAKRFIAASRPGSSDRALEPVIAYLLGLGAAPVVRMIDSCSWGPADHLEPRCAR